MVTSMLSTKDNPFNPFKQYEDWLAFDTMKGYNTCAYLARIVKSSDELSSVDQTKAIDDAIDEILKYNLIGNYYKVIND